MLAPASQDLSRPWLPNKYTSEMAGISDGANSGDRAIWRNTRRPKRGCGSAPGEGESQRQHQRGDGQRQPQAVAGGAHQAGAVQHLDEVGQADEAVVHVQHRFAEDEQQR